MTPGGFPRPRILPVLIVAGLCLLALKLLGLAARGGYLIAPTVERISAAPQPLPVVMPRLGAEALGDVTGSVPPKDDKGQADDKGKDKAKPDDKAKDDKAKAKDGKAEAPKEPVPPPPPPPPTAAEIEVLGKLAERRKQLDERMKELELREALLKTAEKTLEDKLGDLKQSEAKAEAARPQGEAAGTSLKSLVVMYEAMKPRDAARVFEKMEAQMLVTLARQMNPRKLSEVMAQMTPDAAEKLTSGLIRASGEAANPPAAAPVQPLPPPATELQELPRLKPPKTR